MPIPLGSGRRARGERASYLLAATGAETQLEADIDQLQADLEAVHARWDRSFGKAITYRDELLPEALSMLAATVSDYAVDKAEFSSLYEAEVALLDLERTQLIATAETHIQQARATALLGGEPAGDTP